MIFNLSGVVDMKFAFVKVHQDIFEIYDFIMKCNMFLCVIVFGAFCFEQFCEMTGASKVYNLHVSSFLFIMNPNYIQP